MAEGTVCKLPMQLDRFSRSWCGERAFPYRTQARYYSPVHVHISTVIRSLASFPVSTANFYFFACQKKYTNFFLAVETGNEANCHQEHMNHPKYPAIVVVVALRRS